MEAAAAALLPETSLKDLVQLLAVAEVDSMLADPLINLQTIIQAALQSHPRVRQFSQAQYDLLLTGWAKLYERITTAYGLKLRPGLTWSDLALLFNTVVEGALVRARIDRSEPILSNGERVLAGAIFVMLPSVLEGLPNDLGTLYAKGESG